MRGHIREETSAVFQQIKALLTGLGASLRDVVRVTVWLDDMADFAGFNEVYASHFRDDLPARSTVQAGLKMGAKVEVEVQAWVG